MSSKWSRKTATTEQVTAWIESVDDLSWSDWISVGRDRWTINPDSILKVELMKIQMEQRLAVLDAEERAAQQRLDKVKQDALDLEERLANAWIPALLSTGNTDSITSSD